MQDNELQSRDEDFFRHDDLAINIRRFLEGNDAPYNIAIIGKWGLGQSQVNVAVIVINIV